MEPFVEHNSVVRQIWGKSDTILFIFAGAAAEFALNKAVDWLYFTGKLPKDPIGRLFSTVGYAKQIVFSSTSEANSAIDMITKIHKGVEAKRGATIPDWAYRDVLFMLIYYSIAAFELLERKLTVTEKEEAYNVFYRVGKRMGLNDLPRSYEGWLPVRESHLLENLQKGDLTKDLFQQYKKHLGYLRYKLLIEAQKLVVPKRVSHLMNYRPFSLLAPMVPLYKFSRTIKMDGIVKNILLPSQYKKEIAALDMVKEGSS